MNGAQGVVKKIWFHPGSNPQTHLPAVVFVQCDGQTYSGPSIPDWPDIEPSWVPIVPVTARWENKAGTTLSRTQLPLITAWAITIHKSQGLTLLRAVIDLGSKDFSSGLSFVAISRVKTLQGLAFRASFPWTRLQRSSVTETMKMLHEDNIRRNNLGFTLDTYGMDLSQYIDEFDYIDQLED